MQSYYNYFFIVYTKPSKTRFKAKTEFPSNENVFLENSLLTNVGIATIIHLHPTHFHI